MIQSHSGKVITSEFTDKIKNTLGKIRKDAKRKIAAPNHKEASQFLEKGRKKYNKKDYKIAEKFFQKAVDSDRGYPMAHYYLGLAKYKLDDSRGALREWEITINLDTTSKYAIKADAKIGEHKQRANQSVNQLEERLKKQ